MDTSMSDVSLTDFVESKKAARKRKRRMAPLKFCEDPLDLTFNSPDRPRAAANPVGPPLIDCLRTNSWISLDEFGREQDHHSNKARRRTQAIIDDVRGGTGDVTIKCSRRDCVNPTHFHVTARRVDISDTDSDLLLSINETSRTEAPRIRADPIGSPDLGTSKDFSPEPIASSGPIGIPDVSAPTVESPGTGIPNSNKPEPGISNSNKHATGISTHNRPDSSISNSNERELSTPKLRPRRNFQAVGYSQCKSGLRTNKRTRLDEVDSLPDPFILPDSPETKNTMATKDYPTRRVVFESPCGARAPAPRPGRTLDTPDSARTRRSRVYVEDTPEHLVGLNMVTRRLRGILAQQVPDSLAQ